MSYCLNPSCPNPENLNRNELCQACGSKLLLLDRYRVNQILWRCDFGATVLAQNLSLPGSPCCVIRQLRHADLPPPIVPMALRLLWQEVQALGKASKHSQVPRLLDYFEVNREFYIVQEYNNVAAEQSAEYGSLFNEIRKLLE